MLTPAQRRRLSNTDDIRQTMKDALRPSPLEECLSPPFCPRCDLPMHRAIDKTHSPYPVWHCPNCTTNWRLAQLKRES